MAATILTVEDLAKIQPDIDRQRAQEFIDDALALAVLVAPCLAEPSAEVIPAAKAILRGAVLRWYEAGTGVVTQQTAGPFSQTVDTSRTRRNQFFPNEIMQLQKICKESTRGAAFTVRPRVTSGAHAQICALHFGAQYCSCGSDINGGAGPLGEV